MRAHTFFSKKSENNVMLIEQFISFSKRVYQIQLTTELDFSRWYPSYYLTKATAKFAVATSNGLGGDAFTRKFIISPLSLIDLRSRTHTKRCPVASTSYVICTCEV